MKNFIFKSAFAALFLSSSFALFSQNISINPSGNEGNAAAILDLSGNPNLGFLMPTVTLTSSTSASPISSPPAGLIVYNSSSSKANGLFGAGFYYWSGTQWLYLINNQASSVSSNSGTTSYLARWTNSTTLGTGVVQDNGTGVGISASPITPKSSLDVNGGVAIGSYAGNNTAPTNGAIISGGMGIGTNSPNTSAAVLDVTSSTQGILIPRMASNPSSTSLGLMYYNTTTSCFVYWTGTAWQNMFCACSGPPSAPGTVNGAASFCPNATGITYSIAPDTGAVYYTWSVPTGASITAGQGTTGITVNFGTASGNVSVLANNSCAASAPSNLPVTANTSPTITGQPSSISVSPSGGTGTFSVTATGAGLTYQWQVNTGSGFTTLSNAGVYSGVTTATLTVTNPTTGYNGYQYDCVVSGTCTPSTTSNAATLNVSSTNYVPVMIHNAQTSATPNNFVQMITVNSSTYSSDNESSGLQNVEFTTGTAGTGTVLYAWIESGATNSSTSTVYWVNLATSIAASTTYTIYMNFMPSAVMTNTVSATGEAPQLFGGSYYATSYGEYDNGAKVFTAYFNGKTPTTSFTYTSYIGAGSLTSTTDASWEGTANFPASSPINVLAFRPTYTVSTGQPYAYAYNVQTLPFTYENGNGYIAESSYHAPGNLSDATGTAGFFYYASGNPIANGNPSGGLSVGMNFSNHWVNQMYISSKTSSTQGEGQGTATAGEYYGCILFPNSSSSTAYYCYATPVSAGLDYTSTEPANNTTTGYQTSGYDENPFSGATALYLGIHADENSSEVNINWMRARPNPPNNLFTNYTMPTVTFGTEQ